MKKPIKFLSFIVMFSLIICIIYTVAAVVFQYKTSTEISPTVSESVYKVFGTEIAAAALITITKKIVGYIDTKSRVQLMKDNDVEPRPQDFNPESQSGYDYYGGDGEYNY